MKKYVFMILTIFAVFSCSDNGEDVSAPSGQYIFKNGSDAMSLQIYNGACARVTYFLDGSVCFQQISGILTDGEYPNYIYSGDGYTMQVVFGNKSISAKCSGAMKNNPLPTTMQFTLSDEILDVNGDGVLDYTQNL